MKMVFENVVVMSNLSEQAPTLNIMALEKMEAILGRLTFCSSVDLEIDSDVGFYISCQLFQPQK